MFQTDKSVEDAKGFHVLLSVGKYRDKSTAREASQKIVLDKLSRWLRGCCVGKGLEGFGYCHPNGDSGRKHCAWFGLIPGITSERFVQRRAFRPTSCISSGFLPSGLVPYVSCLSSSE